MQNLRTQETFNLVDLSTENIQSLTSMLQAKAISVASEHQLQENGSWGIWYDSKNGTEEYRDIFKSWISKYQHQIGSPIKLNARDYKDARDIWNPLLGKAVDARVKAHLQAGTTI